ncbi:hypothetical protein DYD21_15775 [Rhodohalobacter sp. SW132]|uniref:SatD family protein n=1 Tax=Rhodohalobacter sp. SW132 TaxID=2293433 RepID=UPI000E38CD2F|nr:SatD family protein [Rhodohalobacter sp. SW132]REL24980.1 hypothetical protein DYD21_15775 [Rhodohalobacter sp. SW132]
MIVIIGDIVESRKLSSSGRKELQEKLERLLETISKESESLASPYTITLGDEFQAVYGDTSGIWKDIWRILAELHPVSVRFAISIGTIVTPINPKQAIGMDGPAFYAARERIEKLKKTGYLFGVDAEGAEEGSELALANSSLWLMSDGIKKWKKTRYMIVNKLNSGLPVKKIAAELDISETAVYKNREDGSIDIIMEMTGNITVLMNRYLENLESS